MRHMPKERSGAKAPMRLARAYRGFDPATGLGPWQGFSDNMSNVLRHIGKCCVAGRVPRLEAPWRGGRLQAARASG